MAQSPDDLCRELRRRVDELERAARNLAAAVVATCRNGPPDGPCTAGQVAKWTWQQGYAACLEHLRTSPRLDELLTALERFKNYSAVADKIVPSRYGLPDVQTVADVPGQQVLFSH